MTEPPRVARLLSLTAHELRSPAGVVGGCLRLLRMVGPADPKAERALAQAERSYERLVEVLAQVSDLARLEAGEAVFNRQALRLEDLLRRAVERAESLLPGGVPIVLDSSDLTDLHVRGDPTRLEQAMAALALAAARRAAPSERVTISAETVSAQRMVRLVFGLSTSESDVPSGQRYGVDEFESGLGLSLPIAHRVFEAEGGAVVTRPDVVAAMIVAELPLVSQATARE